MTTQKGKIKWFSDKKGFGFIERESGDDVFIHYTAWKGSGKSPREGDDVSFVVVEGQKGPSAEDVYPLGTETAHVTKKTTAHMPSSEYRFLNPYNFVRYLEQVRPSNHVLGNCAPPPHDRFVGLSGKITCSLEVSTPLFIANSEDVHMSKEKMESGEEKEHYWFKVFRLGNEPAIPASGLRGVIRSVFEASTNSCFSNFSKMGRLGYRKEHTTARFLKPAIVNSLPKDGQPGQVVICQVAKVGAYYTGEKAQRNMLSDNNWHCGERVWARVTKNRNNRRVWQLSKTKQDIRYTSSNSQTVEGFLKITGPGIETKHNEYLFLDPEKFGTGKSLPFNQDLVEEYNAVLSEQIENGLHANEYQNRTLSKNDLVWILVDKNTNEVKEIHRVRVPRVRYKTSVEDLLEKHTHLKRCTKFDNLCPACRAFGCVHHTPAKDENRVAYAGRLRFSHAKFLEADLVFEDRTLAILSTPKPTTTQFYLAKSNGFPADNRTTYDTPGVRLRGRKFYRHFDPKAWSWDEAERKKRTDQNRTIREYVKPGAITTFSIEFENMAPAELGGLLWSLEMNEDMRHRLGMAKPLGFGSVKIRVTKVELLHVKARYRNLAPGWDENLKQPIITIFKDEMKSQYRNDFHDLPNIQDLQALLTIPKLARVHYPRTTMEPKDEDENFNWFIGNKIAGHSLPLPVEDNMGFPLLDREGRQVR